MHKRYLSIYPTYLHPLCNELKSNIIMIDWTKWIWNGNPSQTTDWLINWLEWNDIDWLSGLSLRRIDPHFFFDFWTPILMIIVLPCREHILYTMLLLLEFYGILRSPNLHTPHTCKRALNQWTLPGLRGRISNFILLVRWKFPFFSPFVFRMI